MSALAGTGQLVRLALRRDRVLLPAWLAVFVVSAAGSAAATVGLYPDEAQRITAARGINANTSLVALYGRIYDPTSLGAVSMLKMIVLGSAMVAILAIVLVVRHTRAEEENGRLELLGATMVGRRAPLAAALLGVSAAMVALGAITAGALVLAGLDAQGSLVFGTAWAGNGIAFAAVAAVAAQLTTTGRAATGLSCAVLGGTYLLRAVGDSSSDTAARWLSWLSPLGWAQQLRPFAGNRWAVVLLTLAFAAGLAAVALRLAARRDLGAGLVTDRPGPATGTLGSPLGLAWRLQRATLLGWSVGFAVLGAVAGGLAESVTDVLDSPQAREFFRRLGGHQGLVDAFLATELSFAAIIASAYGIGAVLRLRTEETSLHAEAVLGTAVSRSRWVAGHVVVALAGSAGLLLVAGATEGLAHGLAVYDPGGEVQRLGLSALGQVPGAWVLVGLTLAGFGLAPRAGALGWVALVGCLLLGELGPLWHAPQWALDLSPYTHAPRLPGGAVQVLPLAALTLAAGTLLAAGFAGFRRRDVG
jgi:ABC-2 type transport system permease protein